MRTVQIDYTELRKAAYGYQKDIAARLNRSPTSISAKVNGRTRLTLDDLNAICEIVRRDPADFIVFQPIKPRWEEKRHRVLLRVTHVGIASHETVINVIIPSWNPQQTVRIPISRIPEALHGKLKPGVRLFAHVNIGAEKQKDLSFNQFSLAPPPEPDDGLA